jgi:hypothetical protein
LGSCSEMLTHVNQLICQDCDDSVNTTELSGE